MVYLTGDSLLILSPLLSTTLTCSVSILPTQIIRFTLEHLSSQMLVGILLPWQFSAAGHCVLVCKVERLIIFYKQKFSSHLDIPCVYITILDFSFEEKLMFLSICSLFFP